MLVSAFKLPKRVSAPNSICMLIVCIIANNHSGISTCLQLCTCVWEGLKVWLNDCCSESKKGWILYRPWLLPCDGLNATMWKYLRIFSKRDWLILRAMLRLLKNPELQMLSTDSQRCMLVEVTKPRKAFISSAVTGCQLSSEPKRSWNFLAYMLVWTTMFWMQLSGTKSWKKSKAVAVAGIF